MYLYLSVLKENRANHCSHKRFGSVVAKKSFSIIVTLSSLNHVRAQVGFMKKDAVFVYCVRLGVGSRFYLATSFSQYWSYCAMPMPTLFLFYLGGVGVEQLLQL